MSLLRKIIAGAGELVTDAMGTQSVAKLQPVAHLDAVYSQLSDNQALYYLAGVAQLTKPAAVEVGVGRLTFNLATSPDILVESRLPVRAFSAQGIRYIGSHAISKVVSTGTGEAEWGLGTTADRVVFNWNGTNLRALIRANGTNIVAENIDTSVLANFNIELLNSYAIHYSQANGVFEFYIRNPANGRWKLLHTVNRLNTSVSVSLYNTSLPIRLYNKQLTGAWQERLITQTAESYVENASEPAAKFLNGYAAAVSINGTHRPMLALYNPLTDPVSGRVNTRVVTVHSMLVQSAANGSINIWKTRDSTALSGETFARIQNSFVQTDSTNMFNVTGIPVRATAVDTAKTEALLNIPIFANTTIIPELGAVPSRARIDLVRGDYLIITGTSSSTGNVQVTMSETLS